MSENILKIIPKSPGSIPENGAVKQAIGLLKIFLPEAKNVVVKMTDDIRFIDQGANFEKVSCPNCHIELNIEDWQHAMDLAYENRFSDLSMRLECCGSDTSLNELNYEWPAGFARFSFEINSPGSDLDSNQLRSIEEILGFPLRKIWARY